ncbi:MAG: M12 family metallopeptidase [Nanoarchaeota archaeon]
MRFTDFIVLFSLFAFLLSSLYLLWLNLPQETIEFKSYNAEITENLSLKSSQFYPRMRYRNSEISYNLAENCSLKKQKDLEEAVRTLEQKTILQFYKSDEPEIIITCSNIQPKDDERNFFIAGEGGPTLVINATKYSVILEGKISLYRAENCETPQVAIHELLHSLGFDHNNNKKSIMYPVTDCEQEIDEYIIEEIKELYSENSEPDLVIEKVEANKTGSYVNLEVSMSNQGLQDIKNSSLKIIIKNDLIKNFDVGSFDIGSKRTLNIKNLKIPKETTEITIITKTEKIETNEENNVAKIHLSQ